MAVLSSVSARPARAARPMRPKAPSTALGAGTKSGSTHPARATPSQASSSAVTLSPCTARTRSASFIGSPRTAGVLSQTRLASRLRLALRPRDVLRLALLRPSLGAVLDDGGERVGADDEHERHHDERDVVRGAEEAIGVVDQGAHAGLAAEDLADDHPDDRERESGPQTAHQREQHRR